MTYIGSFQEPDYRAILLGRMNLLIESSRILPVIGQLEGFTQTLPEEFARMTEEEKTAFALAAAEQKKKIATIGSRCVQLGFAALADRGPDEETQLAQEEWIKVYGILYGKEEQALQLFAQAKQQYLQQSAALQESTQEAAGK